MLVKCLPFWGIMVKDFSRFVRSAIAAGYFIERVFPLYHARFISVSDHFDSADYIGDTGGMEVAFKFLINNNLTRTFHAALTF